jgi:hypothetical protein
MNLLSTPAQAAIQTDSSRPTSTSLYGRRLALVRLAWAGLSVLALIIFIASLPVYFARQQESYPAGYAVFLLVLGILVALVWFLVALLVFWRKSNDWMTLLVSFMLVLQGVGTTIYPLDAPPSIWLVPALIVDMLSFILLFLVFSLFPTGRFVPRWIGWLAVLFAAVWLGTLIASSYHLVYTILSQLFALVVYGFLAGFVAAQLYRYHAVSTPTERQQTKWIVFGVTVGVLLEFAYSLGSDLFPSFFATGSPADLILSPIVTGSPILIPLSFSFAILRYHLWEIDAIINRTLVYGILTVTNDRLNFFLVFESVLFGVLGALYTRPEIDARIVQLIALFGLAVSLIWFYIQVRGHYLSNSLKMRDRLIFEDYKLAVEQRRWWPFHVMWILTYILPLLVISAWICLLAFLEGWHLGL